jgi:hypothetical protein
MFKTNKKHLKKHSHHNIFKPANLQTCTMRFSANKFTYAFWITLTRTMQLMQPFLNKYYIQFWLVSYHLFISCFHLWHRWTSRKVMSWTSLTLIYTVHKLWHRMKTSFCSFVSRIIFEKNDVSVQLYKYFIFVAYKFLAKFLFYNLI